MAHPKQVYAAPVHGKPMTEPPMQQAMSLLNCYATLPGVLLKQVKQAAPVRSAAQQFMLHALPQGTHAAREHGAPGNWNPSLAEIESLPEVRKGVVANSERRTTPLNKLDCTRRLRSSRRKARAATTCAR